MTRKKCPCGKHYPSFGLPGEKTRKWCSECKIEGAISLMIQLKCECGKHKPSFNLQGETKGKWCGECKPIEAIDVLHKKCECGKHQPSFNLPGEKMRKWCIECKPLEAICEVNKKCNCGKHVPSFNLPGETKGKWCGDCKPENSIDVLHKKCECGKQPTFNLPGELGGKWCIECKPNDAIDVHNKSKLCRECNITRASSPKYENYCVRCFIHLFPEKPIASNFKIKEKHVFDAIIEMLPENVNIIRDKQTGGCSKRRPDLMIDLGSHWICAENDEDSHKSYDTTCENKRIMELYTDMANRPMILIRFNCDKYSEGKSLFKISRNTGVSVIRSKKEFKERTEKFAETIIKYIDSEPPEKAITVEYLYYD